MTSYAGLTGGRSLPLPNASTTCDIEQRDIPLSSLPSSSQTQESRCSRDDFDEDLYPESTSALLRRHIRDSSCDDDADKTNDNPQDIGLFQRFVGLMSKAPLLLQSSPGFGTGSYGAVPIGASTENSDEEDNDDVRRRNRRKRE